MRGAGVTLFRDAWLCWLIYEALLLGCLVVALILVPGDVSGWNAVGIIALGYCLFFLPITAARLVAASIKFGWTRDEAEPGSTLDTHDRGRSPPWPLPYGYNAVAFAGFSIVACGLHVCLAGLTVLLFPFIAALELFLDGRRFSRFALCLLFGVTLGYSATWAGVSWNHTHCFPYELLPDGGAIIRKGAVRVKPGGLNVIPSHMVGDVALVRGTARVRDSLCSLNHGTGRAMSRSKCKPLAESYDFARLREQVMIPARVQDASLRTDGPFAYRDLDDCLALLDGYVEETERFSVVAYMGHL